MDKVNGVVEDGPKEEPEDILKKIKIRKVMKQKEEIVGGADTLPPRPRKLHKTFKIEKIPEEIVGGADTLPPRKLHKPRKPVVVDVTDEPEPAVPVSASFKPRQFVYSTFIQNAVDELDRQAAKYAQVVDAADQLANAEKNLKKAEADELAETSKVVSAKRKIEAAN